MSARKPKLIGLSLSLCCEEMAEGKVDPENVEVIISRTSAPTAKRFMKMIRLYVCSYWLNPKTKHKAARLARKFYREGKVEQPLLTEGRCPDLKSDGGRPLKIWVTDRAEIKWWE